MASVFLYPDFIGKEMRSAKSAVPEELTHELKQCWSRQLPFTVATDKWFQITLLEYINLN